MAKTKKFPTLEEKRANERKEETPIESGHVVNPLDASNQVEKETILNWINLFKAWLASGGPGKLVSFNFGKAITPVTKTHSEDDGKNQYRVLVDPPRLSLVEILKETEWWKAFCSAKLLAFPAVWSRYLVNPNGKGFSWQVEPYWAAELAFIHANKPQQFKVLDARSSLSIALWHSLNALAKPHGLKGELPPLEQMVYTQFSDPKETASGVSSADVPLSDYAKNHPSKLGHGKGAI